MGQRTGVELQATVSVALVLALVPFKNVPIDILIFIWECPLKEWNSLPIGGEESEWIWPEPNLMVLPYSEFRAYSHNCFADRVSAEFLPKLCKLQILSYAK